MASDVVRMVCPNLKCRAILTAPVTARGKVVRCRQCGSKVNIPSTPMPAKPSTENASNDSATVE